MSYSEDIDELLDDLARGIEGLAVEANDWTWREKVKLIRDRVDETALAEFLAWFEEEEEEGGGS